MKLYQGCQRQLVAEKGRKCSLEVGAVQFQRIKNNLCEEALRFSVQSQNKFSQPLCDHVPAPRPLPHDSSIPGGLKRSSRVAQWQQIGPNFGVGGLPPGICERRGVGSHRVGNFSSEKFWLSTKVTQKGGVLKFSQFSKVCLGKGREAG